MSARNPAEAAFLQQLQDAIAGAEPTSDVSSDETAKEVAEAAEMIVPFVVLAILLGVFPQLLIFNWVDPSVTGWVANMSVLK